MLLPSIPVYHGASGPINLSKNSSEEIKKYSPPVFVDALIDKI